MQLSKNQIKYIKSLHQSKFRQMYENFLCEGEKLSHDLLLAKKIEIELIVASESYIEKYRQILKPFIEKLYIANNEVFSQITTLKSPPEVLIIAKKKLVDFNIFLNVGFKAFYLDGVQDPGNVGTIIRLADWFGFDAIIRSEDTADFFHPKVVQASMGSIAGISLCEISREELASLTGPNFYAMDMQGKSHNQVLFADQSIIVLGAEGQGLSSKVKSIVPQNNFINIGGSSTKIAESLNVAIAAGILAQKVFEQ